MRVPLDDAEFDDGDRLTYRGQPFTGIAVEADEDGVLAESSFRVGVQDGPERSFREDGSVSVENIYQFGIIREGRRWHGNGLLAYEMHADEFGRMQSEQRWDADGNPEQ
ncbi:toxin-antitoxin system YwqK family antitoxin [Nocardia sp. KC 131]|uniref:toxin-antitoxin system YwqK family antitoxin n=1 Tax=Nocardia arseniciresistens TaxID=3392119 RepID=UPI00398F3DB3